MDDSTVPHATLARLLRHAQSLAALAAAMLILLGLTYPWVVAGWVDPGWEPVDLSQTARAFVAVSALGIAVAAPGLRSRFRTLAWSACIVLGVVVLLIAFGVLDDLGELAWYGEVHADVGIGLQVACVGAVLAIISGVAVAHDTPPGWVITGLTGIPIGHVETDPDMTPRQRLLLLLGPSVLVVIVVLVILVLGGTREEYEY